MPLNAIATGQTQCSFGMAPSVLIALPTTKVLIESMPAATITDSAPLVNILPFGMCTTPTNPTVAAATAAALGVLTPMPCVPSIVGTWIPAAPKTMIGGSPALTAGSTCMCAWGGVIQLTNPGAMKTQSA